MYFIIIHYSNFNDFLSVNRIFDKEAKQIDVALSYVIVILKFQKNKSPSKQLKRDFQLKLLFFTV